MSDGQTGSELQGGSETQASKWKQQLVSDTALLYVKGNHFYIHISCIYHPHEKEFSPAFRLPLRLQKWRVYCLLLVVVVFSDVVVVVETMIFVRIKRCSHVGVVKQATELVPLHPPSEHLHFRLSRGK